MVTLWAACSNARPPFSELTLPNIQSKHPLVQFETILSCPISCFLGEEIPHLAQVSFPEVVESSKVTPCGVAGP